ncbi:MAG TPA: Rieske 2Fe-2S domain-containing protein [Gaiellaceae bacterium]|nr:Rieske 2Fe-2S domain-containing protein [Gaiellaceae bacterium]
MPVGQLHTVARAEDVPPGSARVVQAGEREVALFNVDGTFHATQSQCLHLKGPLGHGRLKGPVLSCPWHGWQYDVRTGENEFDRSLVLETFEVVVEDGDVKVVV